LRTSSPCWASAWSTLTHHHHSTSTSLRTSSPCWASAWSTHTPSSLHFHLLHIHFPHLQLFVHSLINGNLVYDTHKTILAEFSRFTRVWQCSWNVSIKPWDYWISTLHTRFHCSCQTNFCRRHEGLIAITDIMTGILITATIENKDLFLIGHLCVLEVLVCHFQQRVSRPFREPVDSGAVHQSWVLTHAISDAATHTFTLIICLTPTIPPANRECQSNLVHITAVYW